MEEFFKSIQQFPGYEISNLGNVKSISRKIWNGKGYYLSKERILVQSLSSDGYKKMKEVV